MPPVIFCPPMNGGLPTMASNPARSHEDLGELQGPVEPPSDPRLPQSLPRFGVQLLDWYVLELVLDLYECGVERRFPFSGAHRLPVCRQKQISSVGEPTGLLVGVLEHYRFAFDVLRRVRGLLLDLLATPAF